MPASLPGSTLAENLANPSAGRAVTFSPFSGPLGSPKDYDVALAGTIWPPTYAQLTTKPSTVSGNASTGAMSNGLGLTQAGRLPGFTTLYNANANPASVNYPVDDTTPGVTMPDGTTAATLAILLAIGGGKSTANTVASPSVSSPYAVQPILGAGNGGSRDAGAGPAFTGFGMKVVTATAGVANGAAIETGFVNRTGVAMVTGQSQYGSSTTASAAVT